jgi:DNA repair exonuclease SbcCD nuclease subunit
VPVPFLVAQLSDPHIGGAWGGEDPVAGLRGVVDDVCRQPNRPDVLLVTGDLTDHGTAAEYATVRELQEPVGVPVYVIPGNHDDRAALAAVLERHPQVRRVVAGHVHQVITGSLAQRPVLTIPSTYVQARLDFTSPEIELGGGAPGFARHALLDGEITSYVHTSE